MFTCGHTKGLRFQLSLIRRSSKIRWHLRCVPHIVWRNRVLHINSFLVHTFSITCASYSDRVVIKINRNNCIESSFDNNLNLWIRILLWTFLNISELCSNCCMLGLFWLLFFFWNWNVKKVFSWWGLGSTGPEMIASLASRYSGRWSTTHFQQLNHPFSVYLSIMRINVQFDHICRPFDIITCMFIHNITSISWHLVCKILFLCSVCVFTVYIVHNQVKSQMLLLMQITATCVSF